MHGYWGGGCCVFPSIPNLSRTTKDAIKFRHNRNFLEIEFLTLGLCGGKLLGNEGN